jgi:hypothetical protein
MPSDCQQIVGKAVKDPDATLDFSLDWADWLEPGDTITASTWTSAPANGGLGALTIGLTPFTTDLTTVWLSGGEACEAYVVTNHVTTSGGREDDRSLLVQVVER